MPAPILEAIKRAENLPTLPGVAVKILELTRDEDAPISSFAKVVSLDPALTGKLLRFVNSPGVGLSRKVLTITNAVNLVGLRGLKVLSLSFTLVDTVKQGAGPFDYEDFWRHATTGSAVARMLAERVEPGMKDEALVGGLLMDIGIIAAAVGAPKEFEPVLAEWKKAGRRDVEVEVRHLEVTHADMSRELLSSWGLPGELCEAIGAHLSGEGELPEPTGRLALLLRAASTVAAIFCGDLPDEELEGAKQRVREWTGIDAVGLEEVLESVDVRTKELGLLLDVELGKVESYTTVRARASSKLAEIGLAADRESAAHEASMQEAGKRQRRLLPTEAPELYGAKVGIAYHPAERVSGDFYGFIPFRDGRVGIFVGDCTGHGIEAAVIMGVAKKTIGLDLRNLKDAGEGLRAANRDLHPDFGEGHFVTAFAGIYDPSSRTLRYARAGHPPPLLHHPERGWSELDAGGLALGLDAGARFDAVLKEDAVHLQEGDLLLIYTDGITETQNPAGEEFGEERMKKAALESRGKDANALAEAIVRAAETWKGTPGLEDDITLLALFVA